MWNIEKDPWLNPSGAALTLLDVPVDPQRFRRQVRYGITKIPRLYQRVVPGLGRISTPAWAPDAEFDLDFHIREMELPAPGTERELFDLAAKLYAEPFDRTRPLWRFVLISGLEGGRGAIWSIFHHAISDGIGQIRMAELYQQASRDEPDHPEVDLEGLVADAVANHAANESGGDLATSIVDTATRSLSHLARRQIGIGRRALGEVVLWPADPHRATEKVTNIVDVTRSTVAQLSGKSNEDPGGSPLWKQRSRHRHLEAVRVPLDQLKTAAKSQGATINDAFMAGLTDGAVRYHARTRRRGGAPEHELRRVDPVGQQDRRQLLHAGTRAGQRDSDHTSGSDPIHSPRHRSRTGEGQPGRQHQRIVRPRQPDADLGRHQDGTQPGRPHRLRHVESPRRTVRACTAQASKVDATVCMGPVAGTAANVTALSYNGMLDLGLFIDPVAIEDPAGYRACVEEAFADILALAPRPKKAAKKTPSKSKVTKAKKKPAKKKPAKAKKKPAKKAAKKKPAKKAAGSSISA